MARAYANAIRSYVHRDRIVGIYAKGSAYRRWDSLVDYVPELSDVDVHVRLRRISSGRGFEDLARVLDIGQRALQSFRVLHPGALHTPRPQVQTLSQLEAALDYVPSPEGEVHTLFGEPYAAATRDAYTGVTGRDARRLLVDAAFIEAELPSKAVDRPGPLAWELVRRLTWRVSPTGPRMLTQLGVDPFDAWSMNRTTVVRTLRGLGRERLAEPYVAFYRAGWDGFHSAFADEDAARRAIEAAWELMRLARNVARP